MSIAQFETRSWLLATSVSLLLLAAKTGAQDAPREEIVVTGSYIKRDTFDAPSPTQVIDGTAIQESGAPSMGNFRSSGRIPTARSSISPTGPPLLRGASLTEAAYAAGFVDSAHYARAFQRAYGRAPSRIFRSRRVKVHYTKPVCEARAAADPLEPSAR